MLKYFSLLFLLAGSNLVASEGLLGILHPIIKDLADITPIDGIYTLLARGLEVSMPLTGQTLQLGLVTVPFDVLCSSVLDGDFCRTCYLDCVTVHNATSGQCDQHPSDPTLTTCLCDYTPTSPPPTVSQVCPESYVANLLQLPEVDEAIDAAIGTLLRIRFQLLLCGINDEGCQTDCLMNHGAPSAKCSRGTLINSGFDDGMCKCLY